MPEYTTDEQSGWQAWSVQDTQSRSAPAPANGLSVPDWAAAESTLGQREWPPPSTPAIPLPPPHERDARLAPDPWVTSATSGWDAPWGSTGQVRRSERLQQWVAEAKRPVWAWSSQQWALVSASVLFCLAVIVALVW